MIVSRFVCMIYVVLLDLDSSLCRGGGGLLLAGLMLCKKKYIYICLDLMMLNPLLPIAGHLAT